MNILAYFKRKRRIKEINNELDILAIETTGVFEITCDIGHRVMVLEEELKELGIKQ